MIFYKYCDRNRPIHGEKKGSLNEFDNKSSHLYQINDIHCWKGPENVKKVSMYKNKLLLAGNCIKVFDINNIVHMKQFGFAKHTKK